jgi:hypothetical protein
MLRSILVIGMLLVTLFLVYEVQGWRAGRRIVTPAQKSLRIASALLMLAVLAMILAGDAWLVRFGPLAVMAYWALCFALAVALLLLALLDFRELGRAYRELRRRMLLDHISRKDDDGSGE